MWSSKALVAPGSLLVASVDARVKSRCRAMLLSVRIVTSIVSWTRALARSKFFVRTARVVRSARVIAQVLFSVGDRDASKESAAAVASLWFSDVRCKWTQSGHLACSR
jgi:hypothetical protein